MIRKMMWVSAGFLFAVLVGVAWQGLRQRALPDVTFLSYINVRDGLGRIPVEMLTALKEDTPLDVACIAHPHSSFEEVRGLVRRITHKKREPGKVVFFTDGLYSLHHFEKFLDKDPNKIYIAYSMFEATRLPSEWVLALNTHFDAVAVPDPALIEVYAASGVTCPLFVIPHGLDLKPLLSQPLKAERGPIFTFGNYGSCVARKNQIGLVRAFYKAFGDRGDVRLCINARSSEPAVKKALLEEIAALGVHNISFSETTLDQNEYLQRLKETDCLINLSKGEGFSIQPREAMACGIPVCITDNTAQSTICRTGLASVVAAKFRVPALFPGLAQMYQSSGIYGENFEFDLEEASRAMQEMVENYESYLAKGALAREWVRQYDYTNLIAQYQTLFAPKQVVLGKSNRIQGVTLETKDAALFKKYQHLLSLNRGKRR